MVVWQNTRLYGIQSKYDEYLYHLKVLTRLTNVKTVFAYISPFSPDLASSARITYSDRSRTS